jgi:arsenate reductase
VSRQVFRQLLAELVGTALLVTAVVGSGVMAQRLSLADVGLQLLENSVATMLALGVLILLLAPVSGAHFNPVVTLVDWRLRPERSRVAGRVVAGYIAAQLVGGVAGCVLANEMFGLPLASWSTTHRSGPHLWLGEVVATAGLVVLIVGLTRSGKSRYAPAAVAAYIGAAYWFTSSTSFANPAVTIGRTFTNTFAGIAPASAPGFVAAQLVGAGVGVLLAVSLYPRRDDQADQLATVALSPADD